MTRGGPANATQVVSYLIYANSFDYFKQGLASAMAYVLFLIIFVISIIQFKISDSKDVT
jgi:multiple sugar transport system permease protein